MGNFSIFGKIFNFIHLAHTAEVKFRQLQSIYRPGKLSLEQIFSRTVTREDVPSQMLSMAKNFDISEHDIAYPNWRAAWIVENCNSCWAGQYCFKDRDDNPKEKQGLIEQRCPNIAFYQCIATEKQAVAAKKQAIEEEEAAANELEQHIMEQLKLNRAS